MTAVKRRPEIQFVVEGTPIAKARARVAVRSGRVFAYTPARTANFETLVRLRAKEALKGRKPLDCPVIAGIEIFLPRPKSHYGKGGKLKDSAPLYPIGRPDLDNFVKAVCDAMNGVCYKDDSQIVGYTDDTRKIYADACPPQVCVRLIASGNITIGDAK